VGTGQKRLAPEKSLCRGCIRMDHYGHLQHLAAMNFIPQYSTIVHHLALWQTNIAIENGLYNGFSH